MKKACTMNFKRLLKEIKECGEEPVAPDPLAMERIPGGLGHKADPADFDQVQLIQGIEVELEHGSDVATAMEIAMDHLSEDPQYYTHLQAVEEPKLAQPQGYFSDLDARLEKFAAPSLEAFTVDDDTSDDVKDLRGQNAEKTGTYDLSKMKTK